MTDLLNRARALLQGETLRAIVYGAAIVVWIVVGLSNALGFTRFGANISVTDALTQATAASVLLTELARRFVYSPATVAAIVNTPPTAAGPIAAAEAAGVDTTLNPDGAPVAVPTPPVP